MGRSARRAWAVVVIAISVIWGVWVCSHAFAYPYPSPPSILDLPVTSLPFVQAALLQALRSVAGAVLVGMAVWQIGSVVTMGAPGLFEGTAERAHVSLAVGVAAASSALFALAAVGAYRPSIVAGFLIVAALSRPSTYVLAVRRIRIVAHRMRSRERARPPASHLVYGACSAAALACAIVGALSPEIEYDALWYHLWLPRQWLDAGHPVDIVQEYVSLYPLGWELLYGAGLVVGGAGAAKLLHWACLPLVGWAAVLIARRLIPTASRPLTFALVVTAPTLTWEATTAYVDLALAWLLAATVYALFRFHESGDARWVLLGGVLMGASLGVKHLALVALAVCAVAILTSAPLRGASARKRARVMAAFAVVALAIAGPWYVRAWAASGNPVFPEMYSLFGAAPPERWSEATERGLAGFKHHFGMGRSIAALAQLPWNVTVRPAAFGGDLGVLFLILVPFAACSRARARLVPVACGIAAYCAIWASPLGSFQLRLLIPAVPLLAVLAAAGAGVLTSSADRIWRGWSALPRAAFGMLLVLALPPFVPFHGRPHEPITHVLGPLPVSVVVGGEAKESYLARTVPTYRAWRYVNAHTDPGARVLVFGGGDHYYSRRRRVWSDAAVAYPATWNSPVGAEAGALRAAAALGLTHVLVDRKVVVAEEAGGLALFGPTLRACCLAPVYEDARSAVYALRPARVEAAQAGRVSEAADR
ncbi:MAG: ArnT family glycosyltransferase [Vicinamibacterales bacterium]